MIGFIGSLKASVTICYTDEIALSVRVLFLKIKILPSKKGKKGKGMSAKRARKLRGQMRKKAEKKKLSAEEKAKAKEAKKASGEKKSFAQIMSDVNMISSIVLAVIKKFFKHLRIRVAKVKFVIATGDAATTAIAYGAVSQALNILLPALESVKNFEKLKKSEFDIRADFASEESVTDVKISFSIRVWQVFSVGFAALTSFIKHKLKNPSKESGHKATPQTEIKKSKNI